MSPRILVLAGSARAGSLNKKLARLGAAAVEAAGGSATCADFRDHPLPLYDGDLEEAEGPPEGARWLQEELRRHDGLLVACPEYNGTVTPLLKNALDWASRVEDGAADPFAGHVAALVSASPGAFAALQGLAAVRALLTKLGVLVLPGGVSVPRAHEAFGPEGTLLDERRRRQLDALAAELVETVRKLRG